MRFSSAKRRLGFEGGFSLPELIVSVFLIVIITTVVVYSQSDFSDRIALNNAANEIEVALREAQIYGVSVKESQPGSSQFTYGYGVVFSINSAAGSIGPTSYISFVDVNPNVNYNEPSPWACGGSECVKFHSLTRGNRIVDICAVNNNNPTACVAGGAVARVDIVFLRPNPNAKMKFRNSNNNIVTPSFDSAKVIIQSPRGNQRTIYVYSSGQIAIQ